MKTNNLARKALLVGAVAVFIAVGLTIGFVTQRDTGSSKAVDVSTAGIRYIEAVQKTYDGDAVLQSTARFRVWLSSDGSQLRLEVLDQSGDVIRTVVEKGNVVTTLDRLPPEPDSASYSEVRVLPPYDVSQRPEFLRAAERLAAGQLTEVGREVKGGRTLVTTRMERSTRDAEPGAETEGPSLTARDVVFDAQLGLTLEDRYYITATDGSYELYGTIRYEYSTDTFTTDDSVFSLEPPEGASVYRDLQLTPDEVASFSPFTLYHPGADFQGSALSAAQESQRENTPTPSFHLVNFVYEGAGLTITNQPAASLAGVPRCEAPKTVVPGSIGDVVLEGNAACGYGEEIMTDLGAAVLRSDSPTVEIQLGQTVVFVHARTAEAAIEAVNLLRAAN